MVFQFEKLIVYQKCVDFADRVCSETEKFRAGYKFLADQLNRAALSIAANIAEGNGLNEGHTNEIVRLLRIHHCHPRTIEGGI